MPEASTVPADGWARRDVLRLGLVIPVLAGCSGSPTVSPPPGSSGSTGASAPVTPGSASPAPRPTVPAAATAEQALSAYAGAILTGAHRKSLSGDQRRLLTFLRDAHADHAVALAGNDPTARPTTAAPSPTAKPPNLAGLSLKTSLKRLAAHESTQAAAQRRAAASGKGLAALVSGSLAVASASYASALGASDTPSVGAIRKHKPAAVLTDVAATQQLVTQLHAVVYGYQLAIGKLKYSSGSRKDAVSQLAATRRLLDTEIAVLLSRKAEVPMAEPAYASADVRSAGDAKRLVRAMQTRLQPFVGLTLAAAATRSARKQALARLTSTNKTARSWGASLQVWPGWPD